ncbi:MAG: hypothetical protein EBZ59_10390 [Planctomycetia bacterium]|nr:hypothetical protein [Planctomycetia bacterium]
MPAEPSGEVRQALYASTRLHWSAVQVYTAIAAWYAPQYPNLSKRFSDEAFDEQGHLKLLLDRLRYFGDTSVFEAGPSIPFAEGFEAVLRFLLQMEEGASEAEQQGIDAARNASDEQTARVFTELQQGSQASVLQLEADLQTIEDIGLDNYLAAFVG